MSFEHHVKHDAMAHAASHPLAHFCSHAYGLVHFGNPYIATVTQRISKMDRITMHKILNDLHWHELQNHSLI